MFDKEIIEVNSLPNDIKKGGIYFINQNSVNSYTHNFFKYPCKFIPEIPRWGLKKYGKKNSKIFDPFAGSGTTILESIIMGNDSYYTEIDKVANLIIKVKTKKFSKEELLKITSEYKNILNHYNEEVFIEPHIDNLYHWFSKENAEQLGKIISIINKIENEDIRDFFKICFVSIIKKCSFADDSSPKPYVSSKIKKVPCNVLDEFKKTYEKYRKSEIELSKLDAIGKAIKLTGDALYFDSNVKFELAITSPPYINAFDYGRTMRLENLWLDLLTEEELRKQKSKYVGTEKVCKNDNDDLSILNYSDTLKKIYYDVEKIDIKRAIIIKKFFDDMKTNLSSVKEKLKKNGHYIIVIGDSKIRNINIPSSKILTDIAIKIGYSLETNFSYVIRNPYINIPRNGRGGKISYDNIIVLKKEVK